MTRWLMAAVITAVMLSPAQALASAGAGIPVANYSGLTAAQQATLLGVARDTWKFYGTDVDPATHLPMDNLTFAGGSATPTAYGKPPVSVGEHRLRRASAVLVSHGRGDLTGAVSCRAGRAGQYLRLRQRGCRVCRAVWAAPG
jgi:hypothetical protein